MVPSAARTLYHPREVTGLEQGARLRAARRELLDRTKDALRTAPLFFWHAEVLRHACERMTALVTGGLQCIWPTRPLTSTSGTERKFNLEQITEALWCHCNSRMEPLDFLS